HGEPRHRHTHGLERQCAPTARVQGDCAQSGSGRIPECRPRHGAGPRPAVQPRAERRRRRLRLRHRGRVSCDFWSNVMTTTTDRYTLISADCHAGANHETYREYLEHKYHEEFDAWRGEYTNPF